jgi:circadian clock protein KaiC
MRSIGLDLEHWVEKGLLHFHATRSTTYGLEMHLLTLHKLVQDINPKAVVFDPIGALIDAGSRRDATIMVTRLIDFLKVHGITVYMTNLTSGGDALEKTNIDISSLVDTWLLLRDIEFGGERTRAMYVLKSRGMAHSNQIREFLITGDGIDLVDVYTGPEGVLTGSARQSQEAGNEPRCWRASRSLNAGSATANGSGRRSRRVSQQCARNLRLQAKNCNELSMKS